LKPEGFNFWLFHSFFSTWGNILDFLNALTRWLSFYTKPSHATGVSISNFLIDIR